MFAINGTWRLDDAHPERLAGDARQLGRYAATHHAMGLLDLRSANRAVAGGTSEIKRNQIGERIRGPRAIH